MSADGAPPVRPWQGLSKAGGAGLIAFAVLYLARELLDFMAGPPPATGADLLAWLTAHEWILASQAEILFFALMCLIPAVPALYGRFHRTSPACAALGSGTIAVAAGVLAVLDIVHGRFAFPVYGLRIDTPNVARFAVATFYGGLHSVQLMLGFAIAMLTVAMRPLEYGARIRWGGIAAAVAAVLNGYPWVIGPSASLALQTGVAAWWVAVGWTLYRKEETPWTTWN